MSPTENEEDWMKPMDRHILELLAKTQDAKVGGMWLKPTGLAKNLGITRNWANKRLIKLTDEGYVETDGRGFYRITEEGMELVRHGDL